MKNLMTLISILSMALLLLGCSDSTKSPPAVSLASVDPSPFLLASEPDEVVGVIAARESAENEDAVVVVGRIGGGLNPWVDSLAAFQIVDNSLIACSDEKAEGEACSCPTPWDYCCHTDKLPNAMALVRFEDSQGKVVTEDARNLFGIKELQSVVVRGVAKRDDAGNLTIVANGMFVRD